jgi:hypothetical protein
MADWTLERLRLADGRWEGRLTGPAGAAPPPLAATWAGAEIAEARVVARAPGEWTVSLLLPPALMTDGTQVLAVGPRGGDPLCLESFAFGDPLAGDLRAELEALRTEVEVLKRALRRHLAGED